MTLTFGSLFSGIGGFDLGFERAGMECKWQVEIDGFCQRVLAKHWPDVPRYGDIRDVGKHNLETVDVICGGFPCQDISIGNQQPGREKKGIEADRSGLWHEYARIINELKPGWVVVENVRNLLSINDGRDFGVVLRDLARSGYDAEWQVLSSGKFDSPILRRRVFLVARAVRLGLDAPVVFTGIADKECKAWTHDTVNIPIEFNGNRYNGIPSDLRIFNGLPYGIHDTIKTCGNSVDPRICEWIGHRIEEATNDTRTD